MVHYIPEGTRTVTPHLVVKGAKKAIEFYKKAFGASELYHMPSPQGGIAHAELLFEDSRVYLADEFPGGAAQSPKGSTSVVIHLYVPDADAASERAVAAGAKVTMPLMDAFWGDRYGQVRDPFGHVWALATHKVDLTPDQMMKAAEVAMADMPRPTPVQAAGRKKAPAKRAPAKKASAKKPKAKAGAKTGKTTRKRR
jgi:PhnB protein